MKLSEIIAQIAEEITQKGDLEVERIVYAGDRKFRADIEYKK